MLKVESMGRSLSIYAPVVLADKVLTFTRVILLTWLIGKSQYGVWALGVMVFSILAPLVTLGSYESVARYVSYYHARGRLRLLYRRSLLWTGALAALSLAVGLAASGPLARLLATSRETAADLPAQTRLWIVVLGVVNGVFTALYHNLRSFIRGLRTFRLLGAVELAYTLLFTAAALAAILVVPDDRAGLSVLVVHAGSLLVMLLAGGLAVHHVVAAGPRDARTSEKIIPADEEVATLSPGVVAEPSADGDAGVMPRLLKFGSLAMFSTALWNVGNQVSAYVVHRAQGPETLGVYTAFRQICQPVWVLSGILWGLVFSYVASHWEFRYRRDAMQMLNLSYKAVVMALTTITMLVLVTAPWWSLLIGQRYRTDVPLLPMLAGVLMFFQASANLGLASIVAKLREKPGIIMAMILAGVAVNAVLAWWWVPAEGLVGAARAAGIGMTVPCALGIVYLLATRFRTHPAAHVLSLSPLILLLPVPVAAMAWTAALAVAITTGWVFNHREKELLWVFARGAIRRRGRPDPPPSRGRP